MSHLELHLARQIEHAVTSISGVAALHPGRYGEVALLYPGERIRGLRLNGDVLQVHVTARLVDARTAPSASPALAALGEQIADAVGTLCGHPVDVIIEDII